jgi:CheY-like chemotaxis protein
VPHKLLLADDSVTIQRVIELTFSGEDVAVVAVGDGEQAIARIPAERPDIVLADIGMPKRSGYDVAAFVKSQPELRHIPVLLLAGAFEPVDEARAEQTGCDGVLVKPFEPQHVIARVRELLDGATGSPARAATADVARPVERLTRGPRAAAPPPAAAPRAAEPPAAAPGNPALDDYFERLDAAFASMGTMLPGGVPPEAEPPVPTLDRVLATPAVVTPAPPPALVPPVVQAPPVEPADASPTITADGAGGATREQMPPRSGRNVIADVFAQLLSAERGEPGAHGSPLPLAARQPVVTDALVDEVTRRVLERLAPDAVRALVVDVVSEVAERLVREEIARIRGTQ